MSKPKNIQHLDGMVTPFAGNGRKLGYPTANIAARIDLKDGVYFGYANLDRYIEQPALIFIGTPTTVGDEARRVEAHLLDIADKDYYGQVMQLDLKHFHRPNETFASIDELVSVMKNDEAVGRAWFEKHRIGLAS